MNVVDEMMRMTMDNAHDNDDDHHDDSDADDGGRWMTVRMDGDDG